MPLAFALRPITYARMTVSAHLENFESQLPDSQRWFDCHLASAWRQALICLGFALALRMATFGDPAVHIDESFYFLVGQWMHHGMLPYVDVWDRKPLGLFLLYYLFAGISDSVVSYQIAAWLFAASTAFIITRMATRWAGTQGAVLAGLTYIVLLNLFDGIGGQSPVFYNLLIAAAAFLVVLSLDRLRAGRIPAGIYGAMLLCGFAITIKQTTIFESIFLGLFVVATLYRSGNSVSWLKVGAMIALGAIPALAIAAFYFLAGHWAEFWHAMVISNLAKQGVEISRYALRGLIILSRILLPLLLVLWSLRNGLRNLPLYRGFLLGWIIAALVGFISVPNLYKHYCLPLMVPFATVMATELNRKTIGLYAAGILLVVSAIGSQFYDISRYRETVRSMHKLTKMIRLHSSDRTLLVFDGPPMLYSLSGTKSITPLIFPNHLNHEIERNVSHIDTSSEIHRIIRMRPGAVAMTRMPRVQPFNKESWTLVRHYVGQHCKKIGSAWISEIGRRDQIVVYGDCR
jgi:hypothetical protein